MAPTSITLLEVFRAKLRDKITFAEMDAAELAAFRLKADDKTWKLIGGGVTTSGFAGLMMFQIVVDLGFYLRAENARAVDDKMDRAVAHLKTLIPAGKEIRVALQFVAGLDPEHGQVKICVEAIDHKE